MKETSFTREKSHFWNFNFLEFRKGKAFVLSLFMLSLFVFSSPPAFAGGFLGKMFEKAKRVMFVQVDESCTAFFGIPGNGAVDILSVCACDDGMGNVTFHVTLQDWPASSGPYDVGINYENSGGVMTGLASVGSVLANGTGQVTIAFGPVTDAADPTGDIQLTLVFDTDPGVNNAIPIESDMVSYTISDPAMLTCQADSTMSECSTQADIDAAFAAWLTGTTATGGCNTMIANDATVAPDSCGGMVEVEWTASNDCGADVTCTATFTVTAAPAVVETCQVDTTMSECSTQADIDAAFAAWLTGTTATGGCNTMITNDATVAPDSCGGMALVTWTVSSDCGADVFCTATFTVTAPLAVVETCQVDTTMSECSTQADIDAAFAVWLTGTTATGSCTIMITNNATVAPDSCGGMALVTWTISSDCEADITCSATFTVTAAPVVVETCQVDTTMAECSTQADIDAAFAAWLTGTTATGGCNTMITDNSTVAPDSCGGMALVTWTISSDCEADITCSATFTVTAAPVVVETCQVDTTMAECSTQADIDAAFAAWLTGTTATGGCNTMIANDATVAPDSCGGTATVIWTILSDCEVDVICSADFTVTAAPVVMETCQIDTTMDACSTQADIDAAFAAWLTGTTATGGCNTMIANDATVAPDSCGGTATVIWTISSDCEVDVICSADFTVTDAPVVVLNCQSDTTVVACSMQAQVDAEFAAWLAGVTTTGGCNANMTDDAPAMAPDACLGDTIVVTWTVTSDCEADVTCSASFMVVGSPLTVTCQADTTLAADQAQADVDAAYAAFIDVNNPDGTSVTGGCGVIITNDGGSFTAPDVCTGDTISVTWTIANMAPCTATEYCTADFMVPATTLAVAPTTSATSACSTSDVDIAGNPSGGSGSYTHSWAETNATNGVTGVIDDATADSTFVTVTAGTDDGTLTLTYTVTDATTGCMTSDSIQIFVPMECEFEFEIDDPCICNDDADVNADNGTFMELVTIVGPGGAALPAGLFFSATSIIGAYQASPLNEETMAGPQGDTLVAGQGLTYCGLPGGCTVYNSPGGTILDAPFGSYYLALAHVDHEGYTIQVQGPAMDTDGDSTTVEPGNQTLEVSNTCFYPDAEFANLPPSVCLGGAAFTIQGLPTVTGTGEFHGDATFTGGNPPYTYDDSYVGAGLLVVDNGDGTATIDPSAAGLAAGDYVISFTFKDNDNVGTSEPGCYQAIEASISIVAVADASWTNPGPLCTTSGLTDFNIFITGDTGGTWSGDHITMAGIFDPAAAGPGAHSVTYTVGPADCRVELTRTILVDPDVDPPFFIDDFSVCISPDEVFDFESFLLNNAPEGGAFTATGSGNVAVSMLPPASPASPSSTSALYTGGCGGIEAVYTYTDCDGDIDTDTLLITVSEKPSIDITSAGPLCVTDGDAAIFSNASATSLAGDCYGSGTWEIKLAGSGVWAAAGGNGLTDTGSGTAMFSPSTAGEGSHLVRFTLGSTCSDQDSVEVQVSAASDPTFALVDTACVDTPPIALSLTNANASVLGAGSIAAPTEDGNVEVTWYGTGVSDAGDGTGTFDPAAAGPGNHLVCVRTGDPSCISEHCEIIEVLPAVDATINDFMVCNDANTQIDLSQAFGLNTTGAGSGTMMGTFSFTGVTAPGTAGTGPGGATIMGDVLTYPQPGVAGDFTFDITYTVGLNPPGGACWDSDGAIVTIQNEAPVVSNVANDTTVVCGSDIPAIVNPTITDDCVVLSVDFSEIIVTDSSTDEQVLVRTWIAYDAAGNTGSGTQMITINDDEAPMVVTAPTSPMNVVCGSDIPAVPTVDFTDNCDEFTVDFSEVTTTDSSTDEQVLTRLWVATDAAGNESDSIIQVININDNVDPVIAGVANDTTVVCGSDIPAVVNPTITDNCDEVFVDFSEVTVTDSSTDEQILMRIWVATDAAGNVSTDTQLVTINDNVDPVIAGVANDTTVVCGSDIPAVVNPTITDNCDEVFVDFSEVIVTDSSTDEQILMRIWVATDAAGNVSTDTQIVNINDNIDPVIAGVANDTTVVCGSDIPAVVNPTITDNCDEVFVDFSEVIVTDSSTDEQILMRIWVATDAAGNVSTDTQIVNINDNIDPVIAGVANDTTVVCGSDIPAVVNPTITDNCDEVFVDFSEVTVTDSSTDEQILMRIWVATDAAGNVSTDTQIVNINDNIDPVIAGVAADTTVDCGMDIPPVVDPVITDNCDEVFVDFSEVQVTDSSTNEQILMRIWVATDAAGNVSTDTQIVNINDNIAPDTMACPDHIVMSADSMICGRIIQYNIPTFKDNCDGTDLLGFLIEGEHSGSVFPVGITSVKWTYIDVAGNQGDTCAFNVQIIDDIAPVADCQEVQTISLEGGINGGSTPGTCNYYGKAYVTTALMNESSWDNCEVDSMAIGRNGTTWSAQESFSCADANTTLDIYLLVIDKYGNRDSCIGEVRIKDYEAPDIECPSDIYVGTDPGVCQATTPDYSAAVSVTDNCLADWQRIGGPNPGSIANIGMTKITLEGFETCVHPDQANRDTCSFYIIVTDDEMPVLDCDPTLRANTNDLGECSFTMPGTGYNVTATDNCGVDTLYHDYAVAANHAVSSTTLAGAEFPVGITDVIWTAIDAEGNKVTCTIQIEITDTEDPVISGVANDTTVVCGSDIPAIVSPTITDNCEVFIDFSEVTVTDSSTDEQQLLRTWIAYDPSGNRDTATQTITINDNEPPVITGVANDTTVVCGSDIPPIVNATITDNCDEFTFDFSEVTVYDSSTDEQQLIRTWVAIDAAGNTSSASQTITINDNEAPMVVAAPTSPVEADCGSDIPAVPTVDFTDNCDEFTVDFSEVITTDSSTDEQVLTRLWVATDAAGNESDSIIQVVNINDNEAPMVVAAPTSPVEADCGSDIPPVPTVDFTDNCDEFTVDFSEVTVIDSSTDEQQLLRTWVATDAAGNSTTVTQVVNINDNEAPMVVLAPTTPVDVDCGSDIPAVPVVDFTDNCDEFTVDFSEVTVTDSSTDEQQLLRTWVATDAAGNSTTVTQTININDNEAPMVVLAPTTPVDVDCGSDIPAVPVVDFTDNCDEFTVDFSEVTVTDSSTDEQQLLRTWVATDAAGNSTTVTQVININDNEDPVVDMTGIDLTPVVDCGSDIPAVPSPVITDNCDEVFVDFSEVITTDSSTDEQILTRTWVATDAAGNTGSGTQVITINDNEAPMVVLAPTTPVDVDCGSDIPAVPVVDFTDNCDEFTVDFSEVTVTDSSTDEQQLLRTWVATDAAGNSTTVTQVININDNEAPMVVLAPTTPVDVDCGSDIPAVPVVDFTDNCDEFTVDFSEVTVTDSSTDEQQLLRTWSATDAAGNSTTVTQVININDNEAPMVVAAPTTPVDVDCGSDIPAVPVVDFTDNCDEFTVDFSEVIVTDSSTDEQQLLRTWVATDAAGNSSTVTQTININDNEAPMVVTAPTTPMTVDCGSDIPAVPTVDFTDNCDEYTVDFSEVTATDSSTNEQQLIRTWVATDAAGNSTTVTQVININDNIAPTVDDCPSNISVSSDSDICGKAIDYDIPTFEDNCDGSGIFGLLIEGYAPGATFPVGETTVEWTYVDLAGNQGDTCSFEVEVIDDIAPIADCQVVQTISLEGGINGGSPPGTCNYYGKAYVTTALMNESSWDNCGIDSMAIGRNGNTWSAQEGFSCADANQTFDIYLLVIDNSGNRDSCIGQVRIKDYEAPDIECPSDIYVGTDPGVCQAVVPDYSAAVSVTDNCMADWQNVDGPNPGSIANIGMTKITLEGFETCVHPDQANRDTCYFYVIVTDDEAPVLDCDPTLRANTNDLGECSFTMPGIGFDVTATDNCGVDTLYHDYAVAADHAVSSTTLAGAEFPVGITDVIWTSIDEEGNSASCTVQIEITDTEDPVIDMTGISDETVDCGSDIPAVPSPVITDNCEVFIDFSEVIVTDSSTDEQQLLRTWIAYDPSGNRDTATQTITINDNEAPMVVTAPTSPVDVDCGSDIPAVPTVEFTDNCDEYTVDFSEVTVTDSSTDEQQLVRTWVATDAAGNSTTVTQVININDNEAPMVVTAPTSPVDADCGSDIPAVPNVQFTDNCDEVFVDFSEVTVTDSSTDEQQLLRTWIARDAAGNETVVTQVININDNEAPQVVTAPTNDVVDCGSDIPAVPTVEFTDNCDEYTVDFSEVIITDSSTDEQVLLRTWVATDAAGNSTTVTQTITINDNEAPQVVNAPMNDSADCGSDIPAVPTVVFTDNCDEYTVDFSEVITTDSSTDEQILTRTWVATDAAGNSTTVVQVITINDNGAPVIANVPADVTVDCGDEIPAVSNPDISDNCDEVFVDFSETVTQINFGSGIILTRTWVATDAAGNTSSATQIVTVEDTVDPTIVCSTAPSSFSTDDDECSYKVTDTSLDPTADDNCEVYTVTHSYAMAPQSNSLNGAQFPVGSTQVGFTVTDAAGNTAECSITVDVSDNEAPTFENCPTTMVMVGNDVDECTGKLNWSIPVATDNCEVQLVAQTGGPASGTAVPVGTAMTVTYTATDIYGNAADCSFDVQVVDTQDPEFDADIVMPGNITVQCDDIPAPFVLTNDDVFDNCTASADLVINYSEVSTQGQDPADCGYYNYTLTRTWTITDQAGNVRTHVQIITVEDTTPPVPMCTDDVVTLDLFGEGSIDPTVLIAGSTDNCAAFANLTVTASTEDFDCDDLGLNTVTLTVSDPCGNSATCDITVEVVEGDAPCNPEYDLDGSDPCVCLNNATTLDNGQFDEFMQIQSLAGQTWSVQSSNGLYSTASPAPPSAPIALPNGTALSNGAGDGVDNDGDGTIDEADEATYYYLSARHVDAIGFSLTLVNNIGQTFEFANTCHYPTPVVDLPLEICLGTEAFVPGVTDQFAGSGAYSSISFEINGNPVTEVDPATLGLGSYALTVTVDAGTAAPDRFVNGVAIDAGNPELDPGCVQSVEVLFNIVATPSQVACNDDINLTIEPDCDSEITADMILEGSYACFDDYIVEIFTQSGIPMSPSNVVTGDQIGQTLIIQLNHPISGNVCWGHITVEDKNAPVVTCPADVDVLCTVDPDSVVYWVPTSHPDYPTRDFFGNLVPAGNCDSVLYFGHPSADDCSAILPLGCGNRTWTFNDDYTPYECADNPALIADIVRTFVVEDEWGNYATCEQRLTWRRGEADQVTWPADHIVACNDPALDALVDAGYHPNITGWPFIFDLQHGKLNTIDNGICELGLTYDDQLVNICVGEYKVVRTWNLYDWCPIPGNPSVTEYVQHIKVENVAPTVSITCTDYTAGGMCILNATEPGNLPHYACAAIYVPYADIDGVCDNVTEVTVETPLGNTSNGGVLPSPGLPIGGPYTITYRAEDQCGNITLFDLEVMVQDKTAPIVVCDEITDINLSSQGEAEVEAEVFDDGSYDNCALSHFQVRKKVAGCPNSAWDATVTFTCCDVQSDLVEVGLRAYDYNGNFNECWVIVNVNDKTPPVLASCPANERIKCDWYAETLEADLGSAADAQAQCDILSTYFGDVVYHENCELDLSCNVTFNLDQCLEGTIRRTWIGRDASGNTNSSQNCTQTIFVDHISDWAITFPADIEVECGSDVPDFGEPEIYFETCELVAVSYEDEIYTDVLDVCYKIERQWTVINWCVVGSEIDQEVVELSERDLWLAGLTVQNPTAPNYRDINLDGSFSTSPTSRSARTFRDSWNGDAGTINLPMAGICTQITDPDTDTDSDPWDGYITYEQVIKVNDTVDPVFASGCVIPDVCISDNTCAADFTLPTPDVDECSSFVTFSVTGDLGSGFGPFTNVAPGEYDVRYVAMDNCNNQTECETTVKVVDCKKPTPYCKAGLVVELMPTLPDPMVEVWALDLDANSFDNCPGTLTFSFSADVTDLGRIFGCDDVADLQQVEIWVTDAAGNQDFCVTAIDIQDNNDACSGILIAEIAGGIQTEGNEGVENVNVQLSGASQLSVMTDDAGAFNFTVAQGGDYTVTPEKDDDHLNGVTTYDLVLITKHILGVQLLDSPYKLIAADANHSETVTTFDLVQIRKLILYINDNFPSNTSWRFVGKGYNFPNTNNPWQEIFPEVANYNNVAATILDADFVGVKIGDVNGSADANFAGAGEDRTTVGSLVFNVEEQELEAGETYTVDFKATDFDYNGYQFTMNFDQDVVEFVDVNSAVAKAENFGFALLEEGVLTASWNEDDFNLAGDQVIFSLTFQATQNVTLSEAITINSRYTVAEAYNTNGELFDVELAFNGATVAGAFELYQNTPNPFSKQTVVGFTLPEASTATLTITDVSGKVVKVLNSDFERGYNEFKLERRDFATQGILYYQLDTETDSATKMMILVD